ncbi:hypothetical protein [Chitinophaga sp. 212800010-3]|uniref:hypothetical protein n=1 Tax=unclassified Chitinophaga TaxID=2619133 RepID=UPI002DE3FE51|nr:GLPGLI family protein [Chitinophaga sp. 212800010-3]
MRMIFDTLLYRGLCVLLCSFPLILSAQKPGPENVIVDGNLSEWGDSLRYYDKAALLCYDVYNDHDFLYIALKRPKHAWNIMLSGRISFEISAGKEDKDGMKIFYPGHFSLNKDEMWNFLEVKKAGSRVVDTVTVYNDYGIQAAGKFWRKKLPGRRLADDNTGGAPVGVDGTPGIINIDGADCELAIPMKLLPVTTGTCYIRINISGEKDLVDALNAVGYLGGFDMSGGTEDDVHALSIGSKLSITYLLK